VVGVDVDGLDHAADTEAHEAPVVSGAALSSALPTVHPFAAVGVLVRQEHAATGLEHVLHAGEEVVARGEGASPHLLRGEIDQADERGATQVFAHGA
jgi:hypothetical protein